MPTSTGKRLRLGGLAGATGGDDSRRIARADESDDRDILVFALLEDDLPRLAPLLEEFSGATGIEIVPEPLTFDALFTKVSISVTQGTRAYDIVSIAETWVPQFAGGDFLASLDDVVEESSDAPFIGSQLALGRLSGDDDVRALPWRANVQMFVERRDLLEAADAESPRSWLDVSRVVNTLAPHLPGGMYSYGMRALAGPDAAFAHLPVLRGMGHDVVDSETGDSYLATPAGMMSMDFLLGLAASAPPGLEAVGEDELGALLSEGRVVMSAEVWADQLPALLDPGAPAAPLLRVRAQPSRPWLAAAGVTDSWMLAMPDSGERQDEAGAFIAWITHPDQQRRLLESEGVLPTRSSVYRDSEVLAALPYLADVLQALVRARPRPRTPLYPAIEEIHGRYVREAVLGGMDGPDALRRAHLEIRDLMVREGVVED